MPDEKVIPYARPHPRPAVSKRAILAFLLAVPPFVLPIPTLFILQEIFEEPRSEFVGDTTGLRPALSLYLVASIAAVALAIAFLSHHRPEDARGTGFAKAAAAIGALAILGNTFALWLANSGPN